MKGHISYCVWLSDSFLLHFTTLGLKSFNITAPKEANHCESHSILSNTLHRIRVILTFPLWDMPANFFFSPCIWCFWHLSNLLWSTNFWFITHPCNKHLRMCSQGPHSTFTRYKAVTFLGSLSRKKGLFFTHCLCCGVVYLCHYLTAEPYLYPMLGLRAKSGCKRLISIIISPLVFSFPLHKPSCFLSPFRHMNVKMLEG